MYFNQLVCRKYSVCLNEKANPSGSKRMVGFLTTHALDTSCGTPAANLRIDFFEYTDGRSNPVCSVSTNADGRTDQPIMTEVDFRLGSFELIFYVGDYYRQFGHRYSEPVFLDLVPIRFGISENKHYHVPLLLSPFGYSTYRGS